MVRRHHLRGCSLKDMKLMKITSWINKVLKKKEEDTKVIKEAKTRASSILTLLSFKSNQYSQEKVRCS